MNRCIARRAAVGSAAVVLGSVGALVAQLPAQAADVSAPYTCTSPLGTNSVSIQGSLTATPNPATAGTAVSFQLHVSQLGLTAPLTINSWSGTATLNVSGAESAQFPVSGGGGPIPANQAISGDLSGTWTPTTAGTDQVQGGDVSITADVALVGTVDVSCTPVAPQPVAETLTVN